MKGLRGDHPKRIARTDTHPPNEDFNILLLTCNGEVMSLTWPQVADIKNPRYTSCRYYQPYQVLKISKHSLKNCGSGTGQSLFGIYVTWSDLVTWPDVTPTEKFHNRCKIDQWKAMSNFVTLILLVFKLFAEIYRGSNWRPSPGRRLRFKLLGSASSSWCETSYSYIPIYTDYILTRARPGVWATFARPGGHICAPPANSKTTQRIDKRKKALDRS